MAVRFVSGIHPLRLTLSPSSAASPAPCQQILAPGISSASRPSYRPVTNVIYLIGLVMVSMTWKWYGSRTQIHISHSHAPPHPLGTALNAGKNDMSVIWQQPNAPDSLPVEADCQPALMCQPRFVRRTSECFICLVALSLFYAPSYWRLFSSNKYW